MCESERGQISRPQKSEVSALMWAGSGRRGWRQVGRREGGGSKSTQTYLSPQYFMGLLTTSEYLRPRNGLNVFWHFHDRCVLITSQSDFIVCPERLKCLLSLRYLSSFLASKPDVFMSFSLFVLVVDLNWYNKLYPAYIKARVYLFLPSQLHLIDWSRKWHQLWNILWWNYNNNININNCI